MKRLFPVLILVSGTVVAFAQIEEQQATAPAILSSAAYSGANSGSTALGPTFSVVERGPHTKVWRSVVWEDTMFGSRPHVSYMTELATGLGYMNPATGQWEDSQPEFAITPEGYAVAVRGQHKVVISPVLNDAQGTVRLTTPEGREVRSTIQGLCLFNRVTGARLVVAEVSTNAIGELTAPDTVCFKNCFSGLAATLRLVNGRGEFHQDVLLNEALDFKLLAAAGFPAPDSVWEIWTEFEGPEPAVQSRVVGAEAGPAQRAAMAEPDLVNDDLDWGIMKMPTGRAYLQDRRGERTEELGVTKRWVREAGRSWLVERIPLESLQAMSAQLQTAAHSSGLLQGQPLYAGHRVPVVPRLARKGTEKIRMAAAEPPGASVQMARASNSGGLCLVLDYVAVNGSLTNYVFVGGFNSSYYVTGPAYFYSSNSTPTIFQGNTTVKYAQGVGAKLCFYTPVEFQTTAYKPVILTAKDDRTAGETYSFGNGSPSGYYAQTALEFNGNGDTCLHDVRISYAQRAVQYWNNGSGPVTDTVRNVQMHDCGTAFYEDGTYGRTLKVGNALLASVTNAFGGYNCTGIVEQVTVARCLTLAKDTGAGQLALTNCVFASVTNLSSGCLSLTGAYNGFYATTGFGLATNGVDAWPFQIARDGGFYLVAGSPLRNIGTTNLTPNVLADIQKMTTYPPVIYSNTTISSDTVFSPQAQRNTDVPDLGYHYQILDYFFGGVIGAANLTFRAGTAVGWFRTSSGWGQGVGYGIWLTNNKTLTFEGTVEQPVYWVRAHTMQEGLNGAYGGYGPGGIQGSSATVSNAPIIIARRTRCSNLDIGGDSNHFRDSYGALKVYCRDCEFWGGGVGGYTSSHYHTNCLFERALVWLECGPGGGEWTNNAYVLRNCTWQGGWLSVNRYGSPATRISVSVRDSAFDNPIFAMQDALVNDRTVTDYDYNAFLTNAPATRPTGPNDVLVTNFNWQTSWLGNYYLPTNSPLIDQGSCWATNAGLYHFTMTTNQVKEGGTMVDIGYHHVAVDPATGQPYDYDGDGIADYREDTTGDGVYGPGDLSDWQHYDSPNGLSSGNGLQVFTPLK